MKTYLIGTFILLSFGISFGQHAGNLNYQKRVKIPESTIEVGQPSDNFINISVKGLANVKADSYVAIFSITQKGKTTEEVNKLLDGRIEQALSVAKGKPNVETYVDMISFVPTYEFDVEKKVFSKRTYNEVPTGFELQKNIHIKYSNPDLLNQLIASCASAEIYDLVRVDYFSDKLGEVKESLWFKLKNC